MLVVGYNLTSQPPYWILQGTLGTQFGMNVSQRGGGGGQVTHSKGLVNITLLTSLRRNVFGFHAVDALGNGLPMGCKPKGGGRGSCCGLARLETVLVVPEAALLKAAARVTLV